MVFTCLKSTVETPEALRRCYGVFPANIYFFKVNKRATRKRCEICSQLTIKTPERRH